ncbi:hypothetical protein KVR01_000995 [Diaporthe batatas]|uniref:uncharacterized protein n=1 Tax=Diaporthe batatas TaxID=748121 RepID=UPI001D047E76|nr:uncharacterized protein KVR01_000995 [Diaporthe batatas]KAG8170250.1 hypothetical protein KVR01_000995 [Diaporthe batatas]
MARTMQTSRKSALRTKSPALSSSHAEKNRVEETPPASKEPRNGINKAKRVKTKPPPKRAMYRLRSQLNKKVDSQDQEKLAQEQSRLLRRASIALAEEGLELPGILEIAASKLPDTKSSPHSDKEGRRSNVRPTKRYMDESEFLEPQETDEMGLLSRYIPHIGMRRRVGRKPPNIPFGLWMAYKHMDDFVYRQSLSEKEAFSLPSDEDAFAFQSHDGAKPSLPPGFFWDDNRRLVDGRPPEQHDD